MKKTILFSAAGLALISMAACSGNCSDKGSCAKSDVDEVYTGVIPAADTEGIRCTLLLDYDDSGNDGDYTFVQTYIQADTTAAIGYSDISTFVTEGDFKVEQKGDKKYIKLEADKSQTGAAATPVYFVVDSGSAITMTNDQLQVTPGLNYTLKK